MDIEVIMHKDRNFFPGQGKVSQKHVVADVWLVKASELGINENTIHARTHLGHLLKPGDSVLGYNIEDANINDDNFEKLKKEHIPDVVIVKKYYGDTSVLKNSRVWKLKHLSDEVTAFERGNKCVPSEIDFFLVLIFIYIFSSLSEMMTITNSSMIWMAIRNYVRISTYLRMLPK